MTAVMFSAAAESFDSAVRELRLEFGEELPVDRLGPDLGVLPTDRIDVRAVAEACQRSRLVFIRHLTVEAARLGPAVADDPTAVAATIWDILNDHRIGPKLSLQVWVSGSATTGYGSGEWFGIIGQFLADRGMTVRRSGERDVLSCCLTPGGISIGLNNVADSLADWPGGRVRLLRDSRQVSRAEFKLEELVKVFGIRLPEQGNAVDLGASPGGWTRILRQHGMAVWAVDPGDLHPSVAGDSRVRHFRMTAGDFLRTNRTKFDLVANDMRMDPLLSAKMMLRAIPHLRPDAYAIFTLKTGTTRPVEQVRQCIEILGKGYRVEHARQLHHNRHEVMVAARRIPG